MADRLQELLQQRALIREHLEWLDAEIAASSGRVSQPRERTLAPQPVSPAPVLARPQPSLIPAAVAPLSIAPRAQPDEADALIARLAAQEQTEPVPSKKGCWFIFGTLLSLLVLGGVAFSYFFYRG